jgi:hypothetical protein
MNNVQHKPLFIDLNPTQAETISAGVIAPGGGQASGADASYGEAAHFDRFSVHQAGDSISG